MTQMTQGVAAEGDSARMPLDIEVQGLVREFRATKRRRQATVALSDVDLSVGRGETFGLLGPNGAGKTTLVRVLSTILLPTRGVAKVLGHDVVRESREVRRCIGLVFGGDKGVYTRVSARENLLFWAALYRVDSRAARKRVSELLDQFGLGARADEPVERFSRGMRQRLHLARGLITDPPLLFLDEPTMGLDPKASLELRSVLRSLKADGRTILLTTHDLTEAEALCDYIGLIDRGSLRLVARTSEVGSLLSAYDRIDFRAESFGVRDSIRVLPGVLRVNEQEGRWLRVHTGEGDAPARVLEYLVAAGVTEIRTSKPSLEEVYLHFLDDRGLRI